MNFFPASHPLPQSAKLINQAPSQVVFIPSDLSNTYLVNHWTNPSSYSSTDGSPYASNLINTTQTLPAPGGNDAQAAYAASPSSLVQITSGGEIYYIANAFSSGSAASGASWSKLSYTLEGGSSTGGSSSASGSMSGSASQTGSASASGQSGAQTSKASTSGGASGTASAGAGATSSGAAGKLQVGQVGWAVGGVAGVLSAVVLGGMATLL
jgi:hypothetical protein